MNKLKDIVLKSDSVSGRRFDIFIQLCIIVSLISFSLETLNNISESFLKVLNIIEIVTVAIFSIEYFLRVYLGEKDYLIFLAFMD